MSDKENRQQPRVGVRVIKGKKPVGDSIGKSYSYDGQKLEKADSRTHLDRNEALNAGDWVNPPVDLLAYKELVENSSILPQCIRAYKNNIAGFGIGVRYKKDQEETPQANAEFDSMERILGSLTTEKDVKEVFEDIISSRETYGVAYVEIIRNMMGEVEQMEFIEDTDTIYKTRPLDPYIEAENYRDGEVLMRKKRFRKYKQMVAGTTCYFKEFGDARIMDKRNGEYLKESETIAVEDQANEILEFRLGMEAYGTVRWIGQMLGVDGARRAERLNNNYFRKGRHTPMAILVEGGTLTDDAYEKLQEYINDIEGENGQHSFLLLEAEGVAGKTAFDESQKPSVEIKDLANILQKDELFQEYLENSRKRVQSSFLLPDIYTGYSTDFNRATAQMAMRVTEEQVFQPERESLAWIINNKLLGGFRFKYVEAFFKAPEITNPDDIYKLMSVTNNAGGLTPNKAKEVFFDMIGETSSDYDEEWGNIPIQIQNLMKANVPEQIDKAVQKAAASGDDEIIPVLKEVRKAVAAMVEHIKQTEGDAAEDPQEGADNEGGVQEAD